MFREFAAAASLRLNRKSVRSPRPPRPDISCRLSGVPTYVELTRMAHAGSANVMGGYLTALRKGKQPVPLGADSYDDRAALRSALDRKANKHYDHQGRPVCLLVWTDGVLHPQGMPSSWARAILREYGPGSRWSSIWVFDRPRNRVTARWSRGAG